MSRIYLLYRGEDQLKTLGVTFNIEVNLPSVFHVHDYKTFRSFSIVYSKLFLNFFSLISVNTIDLFLSSLWTKVQYDPYIFRRDVSIFSNFSK